MVKRIQGSDKDGLVLALVELGIDHEEAEHYVKCHAAEIFYDMEGDVVWGSAVVNLSGDTPVCSLTTNGDFNVGARLLRAIEDALKESGRDSYIVDMPRHPLTETKMQAFGFVYGQEYDGRIRMVKVLK